MNNNDPDDHGDDSSDDDNDNVIDPSSSQTPAYLNLIHLLRHAGDSVTGHGLALAGRDVLHVILTHTLGQILYLSAASQVHFVSPQELAGGGIYEVSFQLYMTMALMIKNMITMGK